MNVLVINGSPKGENSITLQTVLYLEKHNPNTEFTVLHAGQQIRKYEKDFSEAAAALEKADLILFAYPVYTFIVPAQLHRFIELIKEDGTDLKGKFATQLTTSKHFYDTTAHRFIQDNCDDLGLRYIRGLSADMEDLLHPEGRKEAREFFKYVRMCMKRGYCEPCRYGSADGQEAEDRACMPEETPAGTGEKNGKGPEGTQKEAPLIVIVADITDDSSGRDLHEMIEAFRKASRCSCEVVNIREFPFSGGCLGCFRCAADGTCVYKDGFDTFLRERIQTADATVYACTIRDHSMGSRFKMFDDRQFCNGHRTVTMGKPVGYIVNGSLKDEENLRTVMEARAQVGGNYLAGIACSGREFQAQAERLAGILEYCLEHSYTQPKNFYGVGGLKIFRDLIYQMQGLMKEDHRFYKQHGFYDFPQKKKATIAGMYLVGAMMNSKKLSRKLGGKMTEGMLMPYRKVLEKD
ncbi:MAG: NAD(P)H-dependent oxidoreductase [Lachnospiraceae bacterium]|nr:NAD(P)H-dependent oxidoreductase [Lachnospiraceae bacterium]